MVSTKNETTYLKNLSPKTTFIILTASIQGPTHSTTLRNGISYVKQIIITTPLSPQQYFHGVFAYMAAM
jgi:hypothetical protein